MALGILRKHRKSILLGISTAAILIVAVVLVMWLNGDFLPKWIEWKEVGDTSFLKKGVKAQDTLFVDIDHDGREELLVLCWRIGRYGDRKPFWVKHDEFKWSQHIYIYEKTDEGEYKAIWMASDIHTDVARWEKYDDSMILTYTPDNQKNVWAWNSWGLERVSEEALEEYHKLKLQKAAEADKKVPSIEDANEKVPSGEFADENSNSGEEAVKDIDAKKELISIVMVGDVLLHDGVTASCKSEDGYDFSPLFENTKDVIQAADIAIVNQEVIIGGEELRISGYPTFNAPYEIGDALFDAGFDVVCHGTNHALDRNKKGIINCLKFWKDNYPQMAILGIHNSEEDSEEIYIDEVKGIKIAILNYTYGTNGIPLPEGMPYAVDVINREKIKNDLDYAEKNADFTIVCPHWGIEYMLRENSEQESLAKYMTENGADLIIGTHPHVIEPVEWIEADNGNRALCYYSLGNYINWTSGRGKDVANRMVGGMAYVELSNENMGVDERADNGIPDSEMINSYGVYPLVSHVEHTRGKVTTYFLDDYTEELAEKNAITEQDSAFNLEYCNNLVDEVFKGAKKQLENE